MKVYDLDNRIIEIDICKHDVISDNHCLRCGSRLVIYDGDPHPDIQCPVCHMYPPMFKEDYSDSIEIESIEKQIIDLTSKLNRLVNLLKVVKRINRVREKNINDEAEKKEKDYDKR